MEIKRSNFYLFLILTFSFLPLFLMVNGLSVSLPESFFDSNGIPFNFSYFVLFFLSFKNIKNNFLPFIFLLFYIFINVFFSFDRSILTFQALQPFLFLTVFNNSKNLFTNSLISRVLFFFVFLIFGNLLFAIYNSGLNLILIRSFIIENFYSIKFYQSLLSFPLFLNCILLLLIYQNNKKLINHKFFIFSNILIIFLQILLLRKIALFGTIFIYLIFFPRLIKWFILFIIILIFFFQFNFQNLEFLERIFDTDSYTTRENTWEENLFLISQPKIILWGVGENTYAHNYFLGQLITFGFPLAIFNFLLNYTSFLKIKFLKNKYIFTLIAIFLFDCFFNSNLTQTYTVFGFSFVMIYFKYNMSL